MLFLKKISDYLLANIISTAITIGSLPLLTRFLSPEDYGLFALFLVFGQISTGLFSLSLSTATFKYFFDLKKNLNEFKILNSTNIIMNFFIFLIFGLLIFFLSSWISLTFFKEEISPYLIKCSYISGCITYFNYYFFKLLIATEKSKKYAFITIFQSFIKLLITIVFIKFYSADYMALINGLLISTSLTLFILVFYNFELTGIGFDLKYFKKSAKLSFPQIPVLIIGLLYSSFDRIMLNMFGGSLSVGYYAFGARFGNLIKLINDSFANVFGPFFQSQDYTNISGLKADKEISDRFFFLASSIIFIGSVIILFAEEIIKIFTTPDFYPSMYIIPIYVFYHLFGIIGILGTNQLLKAEKLISEIPTATTSLSLNIILNLILIPKYGIIGAATSTAIAALFNNSLLFYFGSKKIFFKSIKIKRILMLYTIAMLVSIISYYFMFLNYQWPIKFLIKMIVVLILIIGLHRFGHLNKYSLNLYFKKVANF